MLRIGTILHPTDFSDHSKNALEIACALARDYGARLVLLHVSLVPSVEGFKTADPADGLIQAKEILNALELPVDNVRAERRVECGDPVSEILRVAKEINADVIVMGTQGRTGMKHLLIGSVTEQVIRTAPCLVLTTSRQSGK